MRLNYFSVPLKTLKMPIIIVLFIIVLSVISSTLVKNQHSYQQKKIITQKGEAFAQQLKQSIESTMTSLQQLSERWETSEGFTEEKWVLESTPLLRAHPELQAIEWANSNFIIKWINPLDTNGEALNLNLGFEKQRRLALLHARDRDEIRFTSIVNLVQGGKGFLAYLPLYTKKKFDGFIIGVFNLRHLIESTLFNEQYAGYYIRIYENGAEIYSSKIQENYSDFPEKVGQQFSVTFKNLNWEVTLWPTLQTYTLNHSHLHLMILAAGLLGGLLVFILFYFIALLKNKLVEIELIYEGTAIASNQNDFMTAIQSCLNLITKSIGWNVGHAYVLDDTTQNQLVSSKLWYVHPEYECHEFQNVTENTVFKLGEGLPGRVWKSQQPAWIPNVHQDDNFLRAKKIKHLDLKTGLAFPVIVANKVVIVLEFFTDHAIKEDPQLLRLLKVFGDQLGAAWEKKKITNALIESEQRTRLILESAGEGIYGIDPEGRVTFINESAAQMLGYQQSELIGQVMHDLIHYAHPDGTPYPIEECPMSRFFCDGRIHKMAKEAFWRKNGTYFYVQYTTTPIIKDNKTIGAVVIFSDISDKIKAEEFLLRLAHYDYLTDLPNRRYFEEALQNNINRAERKNESFVLFYLDLDGFKEVNDKHGHNIGDILLKQVGIRIKESLRSYDLIARLGGDEFAIIFPACEKTDDVHPISAKIIEGINMPFVVENIEIHIGITIGIAFYPKDGNTLKTLMKNTDLALYQAKVSGRNTYHMFNNKDKA